MFLPGTQPDALYLDHEIIAGELYRVSEQLASVEYALKAICLRPDISASYNGIGMSHSRLGYSDDAVDWVRRALILTPQRHEYHSNLIFVKDYIPGVTIEKSNAERRRWYKTQFGEDFVPPRRPKTLRLAKRRLRLGYIGPDFRHHSAARVFGEVMRSHAPDQFEVFIYSNTPHEGFDEFTKDFARRFKWRDIVNASDAQAARAIRKDKIDILIDLAGHTRGHRMKVFGARPAVLQIQAAGGAFAPEMPLYDGFVGDPVLFPASEHHLYCTKIYEVQATICMPKDEDVPDPSPLPYRRRGFITFGSLNRLDKLNDEVVGAWAKILQRVSNSRLLIKSEYLDNTDIAKLIVRRFAQVGIGPDRLTLVGRSWRKAHLEMASEFDIALDSWPSGGGVTTLETLWCGVPVATFLGPIPSSRVSGAIMKSIGLDDWVGASLEDYVDIAVRLAGEIDLIEQLRPEIPQRLSESPWGNVGMFARSIEHAYRSMWIDYVQGFRTMS